MIKMKILSLIAVSFFLFATRAHAVDKLVSPYLKSVICNALASKQGVEPYEAQDYEACRDKSYFEYQKISINGDAKLLFVGKIVNSKPTLVCTVNVVQSTTAKTPGVQVAGCQFVN